MACTPGSQLGHYQIVSVLGKGGMGEVWRARDTTLGREVAIKTLPDEFAQDADRLARLEREAKLLASLNHPKIAAIARALPLAVRVLRQTLLHHSVQTLVPHIGLCGTLCKWRRTWRSTTSFSTRP
jgi:serine/threonine protein kinase